MTINRGLFIRQIGSAGTTPPEARLALAGLLAENSPGVPRQGLLAQGDPVVVKGTAGMSYNIAACNPVISRGAGDGVYLPTLSGAATNVTTTAAPGSGSRWDLIWVKQNDQEKGDADNAAVVGVTQGAAAGTPTRPTASVPSGALVLAEALVASGATATNGASVTITQVWRHTAARNAPITVRNLAERDEITAPALGQRIVRLDGAEEVWRGSAWDAPISTIPFTPEAGYSFTGQLTRISDGVSARAHLIGKITRTAPAGPTLSGSWLRIMTTFLPASMVPANGFPADTVANLSAGITAEGNPTINSRPSVTVKNDRSLWARLDSGGYTWPQGGFLYVDMSWPL